MNRLNEILRDAETEWDHTSKCSKNATHYSLVGFTEERIGTYLEGIYHALAANYHQNRAIIEQNWKAIEQNRMVIELLGEIVGGLNKK